MNVILAINNYDESSLLEKAFIKRSEITETVVNDDIFFVIDRLKKGASDIGIIDIELIKNNFMVTLSEVMNTKKINEKAKIVLIADKDEDVMITAACRFGIDYVVVRPYDQEYTVERVLDLMDRGNMESEMIDETLHKNKLAYIERMTSAILNDSGILPNLKGYKYLKEAIVKGYCNREMLDAVTKYLYPEVAEAHNTTSDRVERAIRHAIESAWSKCGGNGFYKKMGFAEFYSDRRPTNSEYIFAVVEYLTNHSL